MPQVPVALVSHIKGGVPASTDTKPMLRPVPHPHQ